MIIQEGTTQKYDRRVRALKNKLRRVQVENIYSPHRWNYLYTCANLLHLLPFKEMDSEAFYRSLLYHEHLSILDRKMLPEITGRICYEGDLEFLRDHKKKGFIFCSYHFGSFHSLLYVFAKYGMNLAVAVSSQAYRSLAAEITADVRRFCAEKNYHMNFELLDIGSHAGSFRLLRRLKQGYNVLIYLDGETGNPKDERCEKWTSVNFLEGVLQVRKGIASISHFVGAPIVPVISRREPDNGITIHFFSPIRPEKETDVNHYVPSTTRKLFALLEEQVANTPDQWEGWLYVNKMLSAKKYPLHYQKRVANVETTKTYCFNKERYALASDRKHHFLFDKYYYTSQNITSEILELLAETGQQGGAAKINVVRKEILEYFVNHQIFIEGD
ncbi:MAG TPA: hypothetical protein VIR29_03815 [Anseongella sp.]